MAGARSSLLGGAIVALAVAAHLSMLLISPYGLAMLGWDYSRPGGLPITKFHPSTFLLIFAMVLVLLREGNPLEGFFRILRRDLRLAVYFMAWLLMGYQVAVVQNIPLGVAVDTFLVPFVVLVVMDRVDGPARRAMAPMVHALFAANALLGLAEFLGGFRLTPMNIDGLADPGEWRSSAFFGHPLVNALMTGCYALMLLTGADERLNKLWRFALFALMHLSMAAFGGRSSLLLLLAADALALGVLGLRFLAGARLRLVPLALVMLGLPLVPLVLGGLAETGFFDRIMQRFVEDSGSANARLVMFELLGAFSWQELLLGPPQDRLAHLVHVLGLEYGIESFWVAHIVQLGILASGLFWLGLALLLWALMSRCTPGAGLVLLYFFIINSGFLGIGGKSYMLSSLFMSLLVLMPRRLRAPTPQGPAPMPLAPRAQAVAC